MSLSLSLSLLKALAVSLSVSLSIEITRRWQASQVKLIQTTTMNLVVPPTNSSKGDTNPFTKASENGWHERICTCCKVTLVANRRLFSPEAAVYEEVGSTLTTVCVCTMSPSSRCRFIPTPLRRTVRLPPLVCDFFVFFVTPSRTNFHAHILWRGSLRSGICTVNRPSQYCL